MPAGRRGGRLNGTRPASALAPALLAAALIVLAGAQPAPAQQPAQQKELEAVERALREDRARAEELKRKAAALARELAELRAESIRVARQAQDLESNLSASESRLAELERAEAAKVAELEARRAQLGVTLGALQRIALVPPDALLFTPGSPIDTVRSGLLLRAAVPVIERRAAALRADLDVLAELRRRIALERDQLAATARALEAERERLAALIRRKSQAHAATAADRQAAQDRAARLAARAKDLRDLLERVERAAAASGDAAEPEPAPSQPARRQAARPPAARLPAARLPAEGPEPAQPARPEREGAAEPQVALAMPPNIRPFPDSGARLIMPARGRVVLGYGESRGEAGASRGIVVAARRGAQVVAPYDGKVVYAGSFRRYGQILIIEHGGRYHTLLAGLERIDAVVGQWLLAGEPVGVLGAPGNDNPELYIELRHAGQPVNPLPWLATTGDKVRG